MKEKYKIPKREIDFQNSIKKIPESWYQGTFLMIPHKNEPNVLDYFDMRANIYSASRKIFLALLLAFSNKPFFVKNHNNKVNRIYQKSFFLEDGAMRLATFSDLIIWQYRLGFELHDSKSKEPIGVDLNFKKEELKKLPSIVSSKVELVHKDQDFLEITRYGNMIKHGWTPNILGGHYWRTHKGINIGNNGYPEGVWDFGVQNPLDHYNKHVRKCYDLPPIEYPKGHYKDGKDWALASSDKLISCVLKVAKKANNLLVDLALLIDKECPMKLED